MSESASGKATDARGKGHHLANEQGDIIGPDGNPIEWTNPGLTKSEAVQELYKRLGYVYRGGTGIRKRALNSYVALITGSYAYRPALVMRKEIGPETAELRADAEAAARGYLAGDGVYQASSIDRPLRRVELNLMVAAKREVGDNRDWVPDP